MPVLSVIIPCYNCAPYLTRCLDSLLLQNVDMEIVVVDDGSTDGSIEILMEYSSRFSEIKLISQSNCGPSSARNRGLAVSKGEYVYFMDADDFLKSNSLGQIIDLMKFHHAQLARFGTKIIPEMDADIIAMRKDKCSSLYVESEMLGIEYIEWTKAMGGVTLWRHIISRALICNTNLRFDESLFLEEDYVFLFELLFRTDKVIVVGGDKPHFWVKRMNSLSNSVSSRAFYSYSKLVESYAHMLKENSSVISDVCRDFIYVRMALAMQIFLFGLIRRGDKDGLRQNIQKFRHLKVYPFTTYRALLAKGNPMKGNKMKWILVNSEMLLKAFARIYIK